MNTIKENDVTFEPYTGEFKEMSVGEFLDIIRRKLDAKDITLDTKVFSHVYTEPGMAFEFNQVCVDNVDGLDIDVDGAYLKESIIRDQWHKYPNVKPERDGTYLIAVIEDGVVNYDEGTWNCKYNEFVQVGNDWEGDWKIVAWMEIPEYKK